MALINDKEFSKWLRTNKHDDYTLFLIKERANAWKAYQLATSMVHDRYYQQLFPVDPKKELEVPWDA